MPASSGTVIFKLRAVGLQKFFEKVASGALEGWWRVGVVYYPFGLTFNSYQRENSVENRYLYNQGTGEKTFDTERVFDLELNVDQSKYRTYDYITGRWWQIDPLADEPDFTSLSPYNYSFNNPVRYNDPYGDCPICIPIFLAIAEAVGTVTVAEVATGAVVVVGGATTMTFREQIWEAMGTGSPYSTPAVSFAQSTGGVTNRSASDQKLIDQAKQQKAKEEAAKARSKGRQQQTQQGKEKEGQSNQETRGDHNSGGKSKAKNDKHTEANARRAREQAKADKKKEESKKK